MGDTSSPELVEAVQKLYGVFGKYKRPSSIECCPCGCTQPDATAHLVAVSLSDLRFADMLDFSFSALTTQGSVNDFRYLLPLLFKGVAQEPCGCSPEIIFGKLRYAKWWNWPQDEIEAIKEYLRALWYTALDAFPTQERLPAFFEIETVLSSIAATGDSLEWFLTAWTINDSEEADRNLIQFVTIYGGDFTEGRTLSGGFWSDSQLQASELRNWLLRFETLQRLTGAAHLLPDDGFEHLFRPAIEGLVREAHAQ